MLEPVVTAQPRSALSRARARAVAAIGELSPLDRVTALYTVCSATVLAVRIVSHNGWVGPTDPAWLLVAHGLLLVLVFLAAAARRAARPRLSALAEWYPLVVLLAVYASIGLLNAPRELLGHSYDPVVMHWEGRLLGATTLERWSGVPGPAVVNWGLGLSYLAFFPMVISAPLVLWLQGRHEHARRAIFGISLTFFTCYLLFLLFPVAGPAYVLGWPTAQPGDSLPVRLVRSLNDQGDSWGSAFPSSHVAASAAAMLLAMTSCRKLGSVLLPIALGILLAVVYFRVHYVLDAVAGLLIAVVAAWAVQRAWPLRTVQV